MATTVMFFVRSGMPYNTWMVLSYIIVVCIYVSAGLVVVAAILLYIADVARYASPRISPWPRRLIVLLAVLYATGRCIHASGTPSPPSLAYFIPHRFHFYLSMFVMALGAAAGAYVAGLLYALQIAAFLRDRTFRIAAMAVLCPVLFIITSQCFFMANDLATRHGMGLHLPHLPWLNICWNIIGATMAIALTAFFLLLAHRLRRAAANL